MSVRQETFLLFVYGTLKRGEENHRYLSRARYLGTRITAAGFRLVDLGGVPALVPEGDGTVEGELFEVGLAALPGLEALEEAPDLYQRASILLRDGTWAEAYLIQSAAARSLQDVGTVWTGA